jgi:hypothetical protein
MAGINLFSYGAFTLDCSCCPGVPQAGAAHRLDLGKHVKSHSLARAQLARLAHVRRWIPKGATVSVIGDCEFGAIDVLQQMDTWDLPGLVPNDRRYVLS